MAAHPSDNRQSGVPQSGAVNDRAIRQPAQERPGVVTDRAIKQPPRQR